MTMIIRTFIHRIFNRIWLHFHIFFSSMDFDAFPLFKYLDENKYLLPFINLDAAHIPTTLPKSMTFNVYRYNIQKDTFSRLNDIKKLNDSILQRNTITPIKKPPFLPRILSNQYHRIKFLEYKVKKLTNKFQECFVQYAESLMHIFTKTEMIPPNFVVRINVEKLGSHFSTSLSKITLLSAIHRNETKIFENKLQQDFLNIDCQKFLLMTLKEVSVSADQSLKFFPPTPYQETFEYLMTRPDSPCRNIILEVFQYFEQMTPTKITSKIVQMIDSVFKKYKTLPFEYQSYLVPLFFRMIFDEIYPRVGIFNNNSMSNNFGFQNNTYNSYGGNSSYDSFNGYNRPNVTYNSISHNNSRENILNTTITPNTPTTNSNKTPFHTPNTNTPYINTPNEYTPSVNTPNVTTPSVNTPSVIDSNSNTPNRNIVRNITDSPGSSFGSISDEKSSSEDNDSGSPENSFKVKASADNPIMENNITNDHVAPTFNPSKIKLPSVDEFMGSFDLAECQFDDFILQKIKNMTCDELQPPLHYCPKMKGDDIPAYIFKKDPNYSLAVEQIEFIPFFTNPLDVLHHVHYALHEIEMSASIYRKDEPIEEMLPFDVVFGLFTCVVLASDVPEFLRIASFANTYSPQFGLCAEFSFANTKLKSESLQIMELLKQVSLKTCSMPSLSSALADSNGELESPMKKSKSSV
ncbi:hypothetical protein TRFO_31968 [Tritrichomonas foetus]|uniref:VPS9 domain-containing protein n=1 Tax=Tritrichomonas foetus TaxID=1144522 RepID=A0A1J4JR81_9EUKA|nr:hypothetical protein TRFO_31968 [Tritrichomonas foetus]|eukprot:OHT01258.1 hypothetical protein TRFO_31968 [Tritrichomonas foetus]